MGLFWGSTKKNEKDDDEIKYNEETTIPIDLQDYLNTKESQLSNREFKSLLRRQSENVKTAKEAELELGSSSNVDNVDNVDNSMNIINDKDGNKIEIPKLPSSISTTNSMKMPKNYKSFEFEKFRREHNEKESILINCSEIQNSFYQCLGRQKLWDRISAISKLDSDECTKLADFFIACTDIQKKAFLTFDYSTLESIDEMKSASNKIDKIFNKNFKNIDDVREKENFLNYTKDLRKEREDFFAKYNK
ncbi:hypothetical protein C6P40_000846 [Pichia californica]|uniref:Uncharacterized protein n=1 Tax=Pichia californica TaxID=460514 RepID=A0A9P7BFW2_9ASCO|nr:hypothetical protein C6P42_004194 [[Candida] californica]KAG0688550.1 hypothetical protein C6P40_000846 [[Candida] californica]